MSEIWEILLTYLTFTLPWPTAFLWWAFSEGPWHYVVIWIVVGLPVGYLLKRRGLGKAFLAWIITWFMPSTIICGAATLVPWSFAFYNTVRGNDCSSWLSLGLSLALNATAVLTGSAIFNWFCKHDRLRPN